MKTAIRYFRLFSGLILFVGLSSISCKKTVVGPKGDTGQQGETGNANVKSYNFATTCQWKADSTSNSYTYRYYLADLDSKVLQSGIAIVYYGNECGCEWRAMPFKSKTLEYSFSVELSTIEITVTSTDNTMPAMPGVQKFKLVLIPPAQ